MSDLLPLFPLPNVVLFPNVFLPLHIFEPRYREMVADALAGDRMIGMVLLRPGWEHDYEGRPPVYRSDAAACITHFERLPDGRYNIVLRGLERFRILEEDDARSYRRAMVEPLADAPLDADDRRGDTPPAIEARSAARPAPCESAAPMRAMPSAMADEDLDQRARAISRPRAAREAGAARTRNVCAAAPSRSSNCSR